MCGLVPHFHGGEASGELVVGGLDVREHGPGELAAVCGTVFQEPETQVVMGGVRAELELPLEHRGESPAALARAVEETALALGVGHLLERRTDTLSGGELQRVALAAAMVHGPELLLLDEPTSQLDPVAGDELVWLLRRLNEDWGTAVVVAEHRLERCLPAADRVIALVEGRVACDAPPAEFLAWAVESMPALATPAARLFSLAGLPGRPSSVKEARAGLRESGAWQPPGVGAAALRHLARPAQSKVAGGSAAATARAGPRHARRLARDRGRANRPSRARPRASAGRARRAHGPQRGRQEHAAAARQGPRRADPRTGRARRRRGAAAPDPGRLPDPRARRRRRRRRGCRRRGAGGSRAGQPARSVRWRAPATRPRGGPGRRALRGGAARRADTRHGPRPQGRARGADRRAGRRRARQWWWRPTTPSSRPRSPTGSCCSARAS